MFPEQTATFPVNGVRCHLLSCGDPVIAQQPLNTVVQVFLGLKKTGMLGDDSVQDGAEIGGNTAVDGCWRHDPRDDIADR